METLKVVFTKNKYRFSIIEGGKLFIENLESGRCDYPIKYTGMAQVAYDYPEIWPPYIKKAILKWAIRNRA